MHSVPHMGRKMIVKKKHFGFYLVFTYYIYFFKSSQLDKQIRHLQRLDLQSYFFFLSTRLQIMNTEEKMEQEQKTILPSVKEE